MGEQGSLALEKLLTGTLLAHCCDFTLGNSYVNSCSNHDHSSTLEKNNMQLMLFQRKIHIYCAKAIIDYWYKRGGEKKADQLRCAKQALNLMNVTPENGQKQLSLRQQGINSKIFSS